MKKQHPIQPLYLDRHKVIRFHENKIVSFLARDRLNELAAMNCFSREDWQQLAQLIGYSLSGYGELSYVTDKAYERAAQTYPQPKEKP